MSTLVLASANDNFRDEPATDLVSVHLTSRRMQRHLVTVVAALAAVVLVVTLHRGYESMRPLPDQTFAYRV